MVFRQGEFAANWVAADPEGLVRASGGSSSSYAVRSGQILSIRVRIQSVSDPSDKTHRLAGLNLVEVLSIDKQRDRYIGPEIFDQIHIRSLITVCLPKEPEI